MLDVILCSVKSYSFRDWLSLVADLVSLFGVIVTVVQIFKVKKKVESSINAMNEMARLQEQELLKKTFKELTDAQENLNWLLAKHGQSGYRKDAFEGEKQKIISTINRCVNAMPTKYKEITEPLRLTHRELLKYNGDERKPLEEAEGYLYSALQATKAADEQCSAANIDLIAHTG